MSKIEQEIFKSIQTIAQRIYDKNSAGQDRTIQGLVTATPIDKNNPFYTIQYENAQYHAKYSGQEEIQIGDVVCVLIPNSINSNTKFILGKV